MGDLNIKSSTIEKSLDLVKEFLQKLVEPSIEELGLLLSDNIKLLRLKNQIRNLEKVKKIVAEEKINIKQVNLKVLIPYLEGVSIEDDETLQTLWAKLFTNYIDASKNLVITVYPSILKQLSTSEVKLLEFIQSKGGQIAFRGYNKTKEIQFSSDELVNLERLGLIKEAFEISQYGGDSDDRGRWRWDLEEVSSGEFYLTDFGFKFLDACKR